MAGSTDSNEPMHLMYPMTSKWEFTLQSGDKVSGEVYCTDPVAGLVVLVERGDIKMITAETIQESKLLHKATTESLKSGNMMHSKKVLDEREKRGIRLAQESLRHLNPKASPRGQAVFDRLLKACNEVVWKAESVIVLNQIQVDPPYAQENCKLLQPGSAQAGGSLERVQKIVASTNF
mmetsp:Transcript_12836/g.30482  ORF Transcript_12836/g.30482 Transcript_12836/m.30482 type:complete len:178 (+) Transcript_12836:73-606(+)|eukprot:CAMPEP_0113631336 /NCGR_PEP_ID=MMETSP0017_2-20120614/16283_1 /TAXON_ID=2856 /ORGANISM="Cylindrotheca closterium" /LENGTH=177 /DNA_ID=CAMNT_0000541839 /DNA_START=71 /DNA_END=604 /DNA_ORIENTATION=+ /assembly_acc=CAM_ASM_000147